MSDKYRFWELGCNEKNVYLGLSEDKIARQYDEIRDNGN